MKVLMLGWEFPPYKSGGLGTACYGLTKGLSKEGVHVTFVMPHTLDGVKADFVHLIVSGNRKLKFRGIKSNLTPYMGEQDYEHRMSTHYTIYHKAGSKEVYGRNLYEEVGRFTHAAREIAEEESHDIIHAHDWMTYRAGMEARKVSGKPFVAHIHATEFDRTGGNPNQSISHIEYEGLKAADMVIANSNYTKNNIINYYGIDPKKIRVVHFGIDQDVPYYNMNYTSSLSDHDKIVLFLGRVTLQKGPDYFIEAAANVLKYKKNVRFIVAGSGDMLPRIINRAVELGIADRVTFTGFLEGEEVHKAFQMADLYVMPSVSEPYGLVALEALKNKTPVIISKQSGVSEVLHHALKVDFWDINEMTNKIVSTLNYQELFEELKNNGNKEVEHFTLDEPAKKVIHIYKQVLDVYQQKQKEGV